MQMKTIRLAVLASVLVSAGAYAAEPFVGPTVGLSVSSVRSTVDFGGSLNIPSMSTTRTTSDLNVGYGFAVAPKVVVNTGMSINLDQPSLGSSSYLGGTETVSGKMKDRWSLSVAPGYLVTPKLMAYGKVAYQYANIEVNDSFVGSVTKHFHGWGYGVGVAYQPMAHVETSLEWLKTEYSTQHDGMSTGRPMTSAVTLGVNYRF
ncbi:MULTISPECIES: porin family protein [unclassified Paludibacterium]|uniref:porin family protein n=1 Tax=unclassified Paludibacterium TaxID=2618429 RepID=UPI001C045023|nr:porin family protein [Paludibacterium sp. B53371]BEV73608.1 hypothetical protein THUN1379_30900 [Paludibacterium sp. THUN1379]